MMGDLLDSRTAMVLAEAQRSAFASSPEMERLLSGHSIPSRAALAQLLAWMPVIDARQRVLQVGAGSGYVSLILAQLAQALWVLERDPIIIDIARRNLTPFKLANVHFRMADGEQGWSEEAPFDVIVALCGLQNYKSLLAQLAEGGQLITLEPMAEGQWSAVVSYHKQHGGIRRHDLGVIDFAQDISDVYIDIGITTPEQLAQAKKEAAAKKVPLVTLIQQRHQADAITLYRNLAQRLGLTFTDADNLFRRIDRRLFSRFSRTFLDSARLIPIVEERGNLLMATDDPEASTDGVSAMYGSGKVELVLVTSDDFRRLWSTVTLLSKSERPLLDAEPAEKDLAAVAGKDDGQISPYLVSMYESILLDAVSSQASDIHLERYGQRVRIRLRIDGELRDEHHYALTPAELAGLINVIKTRSELDIAERRLPQGGRAGLNVGEMRYDLRVQTQPSLHGEHVVIRLLPQKGRAMSLDQLGMPKRITGQYRRLLRNPVGLVLVVGPTGSGKSTTLSAGLQELADDGRRKVITVEDPIEFAIDNIQQTQVKNKIAFGFADAMRSFVRQDPDVIMVGEIRDGETALEAARASQTGHLVLSTLHCNDAVDAVQRLYDLGLHCNSIASELLAVIAQRLAKRICPHCRTLSTPDPAILTELFPEEVPANFRCYVGKGCKHCQGRGTKGRIAVTEFMQVNQDYRDVISRQPSQGELRWRALDAGLVTMRDSALELVMQGIIPLSELPRILPAERMAPEKRGAGER